MSTAALLRTPAIRSEPLLPLQVKRLAHVSRCGAYRWSLQRWFGPGDIGLGPVLPWIMLNPSTADGYVDDPTLKRIIAFSWRWGFDGLLVLNLYPFRSSKPAELAGWQLGGKFQGSCARDRLWENWSRAAEMLRPFDAAMVAWGSPSGYLARETEIVAEGFFDTVNNPDGLRDRSLDDLFCLGTTHGGDPIHPMARGVHRVPDTALPQPYPRAPGTVRFGSEEDAA